MSAPADSAAVTRPSQAFLPGARGGHHVLAGIDGHRHAPERPADGCAVALHVDAVEGGDGGRDRDGEVRDPRRERLGALAGGGLALGQLGDPGGESATATKLAQALASLPTFS